MSKNRTINVALAGNPNCGKTTIFNHLTGARQRVGNFSGVTVTRKEGTVSHKGWTINIIDLPGTYSLSSKTVEERVAREYILDESPDLVVDVVDAGNLERNLFLTTQLIEMDLPRVINLNMIDEVRAQGMEIDSVTFSQLLGAPVVETVGRTGEGKKALLDAIVQVAEEGFLSRQIRVPYDHHVEEAIERTQDHIARLHPGQVEEERSRWLAIKLLEGDSDVLAQEHDHADLIVAASSEQSALEESHGEDSQTLLADGRYGFIHGLVQETLRQSRPVRAQNMTRKIDQLLLNRVLGLPLFLFFMWLMFQTTFTVGQYPMDWIDAGVGWLSDATTEAMPEGLIRDLLVDGIIGGVGGIIIFLPNIVLLFLFISFFENTGYMARAAFLMDRFMHGIGLHGKAFIPLLMGFGCNVPAIMATRTIENPRDRLLTILINPFMSCSARLPVYVLLAGIFFTDYAGSVVFALYLTGILVAMGAAWMMKKTMFHGLSDPFVMELPPYRLPAARSVIIHMWEKAVEFLKKVSGIILVGSIIIWFLQAFPQEVELSIDYAAEESRIELQMEEEAKEAALAQLANAQAAEEQERRYLGQIGQTIQPIFEPLGFDWKASIALLTGFVAKEIVVSTFGVLYNTGDKVDEESVSLREAMAGSMAPEVALAFMVFTLLYMPCLATIAVIRRETQSVGWTLFSIGMGLGIAWILAWIVVRVARLFI